jgi:L-lysine 2,3-aminomutase
MPIDVAKELANVTTESLLEGLRVSLKIRDEVVTGGDAFKHWSLAIRWINEELESRGQESALNAVYDEFS